MEKPVKCACLLADAFALVSRQNQNKEVYYV
jgi:hypothetical protein